jgi:uncharacterized protein YkwD
MTAALRTPTSRLRALAVSAAIAGSLAAPASALACGNVHADANRASIEQVDVATVCLLNAQRRRHHLPPLHVNKRLSLASARHARDMAARHYFEHGDFVGRIKRSGYLRGAGSWDVGENIAWGGGPYSTPKSIVSMWMHSPGHRANILDTHFKDIGIGIARGAPQQGQHDAATYTTDFGVRS